MKIYRNSTPLIKDLQGVPVYMHDMTDACLRARLNLFLVGDTGSGKTQLARDVMSDFGDKSLFILGRNDMDTRELFQQINLEKYRAGKTSAEIKELTSKINTHLIVVDELPNCVPAVRAQLFNLFDGFVEINGTAYPIGAGYSVGIATGNLGQRFTESSNDLGRALKDRMHVVIDTDYFAPTASDLMEIISSNTNPRVVFDTGGVDRTQEILQKHKALVDKEIPFEKLIIANYLAHGLDYCHVGDSTSQTPASKRKMKDQWPAKVANHAKGSDEALALPLSPRGVKSTIGLSQALDEIVQERAGVAVDPLASMLQAYKFVAAYSGVLNDSAVDQHYDGDKYKAIDALNTLTASQFNGQRDNICAGLEMVKTRKMDQQVLNAFRGRWAFMKDVLQYMSRGTQE